MENLKTITVSQNSKPGRLGLTALFNKGFVGPPHALNDLDLRIYLIDNIIYVHFYDMDCSLNPKDKVYPELRQYL
ncbi:Uncharacterised protein [uncultured archaeon]|nr:Uncharacterised protein [uncultured archaeon]